jgi:hypothetical protein
VVSLRGGDGGGLVERLVGSAADSPQERAALAVLAEHGHWLGHEGFVRACVRELDGQAWVMWKGVPAWLARTRCTALEREVLLLAVEMAGSGSVRRFVESAAFDDLDPAVRERMAVAARSRGAVGDAVGAEALAVRLRTWAAGPEARAAVDLLIARGWLADEAFVQACVVPIRGDLTIAVVDWAGMGHHARQLEESGDDRAGGLWEIHAVAARAWGGSLGDREAEP